MAVDGPLPAAVDVWDAGELACGELVLDLRGRLRQMPGRVLRVIALDPGAHEDIPSWCRLTGHALVHQDQATNSYWIRARGEASDDRATVEADAPPDFDRIYTPKVFELAASIAASSHLTKPDATGAARSRLCGSTIEVDLQLSGRLVTAYAHRIKACLLGRAVAAVVAREIVGTPVDELRQVSHDMRAMLSGGDHAPAGRWSDLAALAPVRTFRARHPSTLIVFDALDRAIDGIEGDGGVPSMPADRCAGH